MFSPRRPLVVLWLLLALLPLRGWAGALMHLPGGEPAAAVAMPCHGAAADDAREAGHDAHASPAADACSLCDLCHGVAALPTAPTLAADVVADAPPGAEPQAPPLVVPPPLYRPPRA